MLCVMRFASAQLATAHKLTVIAHSANAFVAITDLLMGKCIAVLLNASEYAMQPRYHDGGM